MASFVVQLLGSLCVEEGKYLYEVRDKVESLQTELKRMECLLQDADADNREHREKAVKQWVAEIRDFAYDAQDIIERYVHLVPHQQKSGVQNPLKRLCCSPSDALLLRQVRSDIDDLITKLRELTNSPPAKFIPNISQSESSDTLGLGDPRWTYPLTEEHAVGLEKDIEKLVHVLVDTESLVVGIYGMGGLGKTTLAREVYSNAAIKQQFTSCAWVYVSQKADRRSIFEEILSGLRKGKKGARKVKDLTDQLLHAQICAFLRNNKCLVVLDDLWTVEHARKLIQPFFATIQSSSSKILLTTRNQTVSEQVYPYPHGYSHRLRLLDEEEAWRLLRLKAFVRKQNEDVVVGPEKEELGRKMLKHCRGLPLAIIALGGILADKNTDQDWEDVEEKIRNSSLISELEQGSADVNFSPVLELSFYELPFYLKPCFLYLGNFPEDHEISAKRLCQLWEAEGIVNNGDGRNGVVSSNEIAERYLNELAQRCMVQVGKRSPNGRIRSCRVHDVMLDMCLKKCNEVNFLSFMDLKNSDNPSSDIAENKKMRRCAFRTEKRSHVSAFFCQHEDNDPCLRSLLVHGLQRLSRDNIASLFSSKVKNFLSLLRVLQIQSFFLCPVPEAIGELIHLRYLSFRNANFRELPSCIFNLKYLETLDLRTPWERSTLPNEFWKLKKLRHLYLPRSFEVKGSEKLIIVAHDHQSSQMQTLINFNARSCKIEDLSKMEYLKIFKMNIRLSSWLDDTSWSVFSRSPLVTTRHANKSLKLYIVSTILNKEPSALSSLKAQADIRSLIIFGHLTVKFQHDQAVFPCNLTKVRLFGCDISEECVLELGKLPHLEVLLLDQCHIKGGKMSFPDGSFLELVKLDLDRNWGLEEWEVGEAALPNLRYLMIYIPDEISPVLKMIPEGLPSSVHIDCGCFIKGIEKYNTCPDSDSEASTEMEEASSSPLVGSE